MLFAREGETQLSTDTDDFASVSRVLGFIAEPIHPSSKVVWLNVLCHEATRSVGCVQEVPSVCVCVCLLLGGGGRNPPSHVF